MLTNCCVSLLKLKPWHTVDTFVPLLACVFWRAGKLLFSFCLHCCQRVTDRKIIVYMILYICKEQDLFGDYVLQKKKKMREREREKKGKRTFFYIVFEKWVSHRGCRIDLIIITGSLSIIVFRIQPSYRRISPLAAAISGIHYSLLYIVVYYYSKLLLMQAALIIYLIFAASLYIA